MARPHRTPAACSYPCKSVSIRGKNSGHASWNLTASPGGTYGTDSMGMNWDYDAAEPDYLLWRSDDDGETWTPLTPPGPGDWSYEDTGLDAATRYVYRLWSENGSTLDLRRDAWDIRQVAVERKAFSEGPIA